MRRAMSRLLHVKYRRIEQAVNNELWVAVKRCMYRVSLQGVHTQAGIHKPHFSLGRDKKTFSAQFHENEAIFPSPCCPNQHFWQFTQVPTSATKCTSSTNTNRPRARSMWPIMHTAKKLFLSFMTFGSTRWKNTISVTQKGVGIWWRRTLRRISTLACYVLRVSKNSPSAETSRKLCKIPQTVISLLTCRFAFKMKEHTNGFAFWRSKPKDKLK